MHHSNGFIKIKSDTSIMSRYLKLFFLGLPILLLSCSQKPVFEQYREFSDRTWQRFDSVIFEFPVTDTVQEYDIYFVFRYIPEDYTYQKLEFDFTVYTPSGEMRASTHKIWTIDEEGRLNGEKQDGFREIKVPVRKKFVFVEPGIAKFVIESRMPKIETPGVKAVGVVVEKGEKKDDKEYR